MQSIYVCIGFLFLAVNYFLLSTTKKDKRKTSYEQMNEHEKLTRSPIQKIFHFLIVAPLVLVTGVAIALIFWPLFLFWKIRDNFHQQTDAAEHKPFAVSPNDLITEMTIEEVESQELVVDPLEGAPNLPFGHLNKHWIEFLSEKKTERRYLVI